MAEAEREIQIVLDHARMAGFLEGVVPGSSVVTDHHFGSADVRRGIEAGPDPWSELGLTFDGRVVVSFEPELVVGGLKLWSHKVMVDYSDQITNPLERPGDHGADVTEKSIVLQRVNEVTREHSWENSSAFPPGPTAIEDIVRDIERFDFVTRVLIMVGPESSMQATAETDIGTLIGKGQTTLEALKELLKVVFEHLPANPTVRTPEENVPVRE
jgi:hypothetical protein